jgi:hypothetical protein
MTDSTFLGFNAEVTTSYHIHHENYAHHRMSDVISDLVSTDYLKDLGIQKMELTPLFEVKKSTCQLVKSRESPRLRKQVTINDQGIL